MQLLILENDFKICYSQRENIKSEFDKLHSSNAQLKESFFIEFEKEIQIIREKLIEKTNEMLRFELYHNDVIHKNNSHLKEITESHSTLQDENQKLKSMLNELAVAYKKGNESDLKILLNYVTENINEYDDIIKPEKKENSLDQTENEESSKILKTEEAKGDENFVQKVIGEFDKVLSEEFKRVEGYFKRDNSIQRKKSLLNSTENKRRASAGKNYVVWTTKSQSLKWSESLRTKSEKEENKRVDFSDLAHSSKMKIRNSIRLVDAPNNCLTPDRKSEESFLKGSIESDTLSKFYENQLAKSHSHVKDLYSKKMHKKEVVANEYIHINLENSRII